MSDAQLQAIKDIVKMTPRLNMECLTSIKVLIKKAIDSELLKIEPTVILENMDITKCPAIAVITKRFYGPVPNTGGCLPKYLWVSYL